MKKLNYHLTILLISFLMFNIGVGRAYANSPTGTASFSIAGGTYEIGTIFPATIYTNSADEPVNVVQAKLKYDSTKLQIIDIDTSGSSFGGSYIADGGGGNITIVRFAMPGTTVKQTAQVATIHFKALASTGATTVNILPLPDSYLISAKTNKNILNDAHVSASYSFTEPMPDPAPVPTPAPTTPVKTPPVASARKPQAAVPVAPVIEEATEAQTTLAISEAMPKVRLPHPTPSTTRPVESELPTSMAMAGLLFTAVAASGKPHLSLMRFINWKNIPRRTV